MNLRRRGAVAGLLAAAMMPAPCRCAGPWLRALTRAYNASGQDLFQRFPSRPATSCSRPIRSAPPWRWCWRARAAKPSARWRACSGTLCRATTSPTPTPGCSRSSTATTRPRRCPSVPTACSLTACAARCRGRLTLRCPPRTPLRGRALLCDAGASAVREGRGCQRSGADRKDAPVSSDFIALVKSKFAAELFQDAGLEEINALCCRQTEGRIERILDQLDPSRPQRSCSTRSISRQRGRQRSARRARARSRSASPPRNVSACR